MATPRAQALCLADGRLCEPGSVGLPAFRGTEPHPHVMQSGTRRAICDAQRDSGTWDVELIAVEYDHAAAVQRAQLVRRLPRLRDGRRPVPGEPSSLPVVLPFRVYR